MLLNLIVILLIFYSKDVVIWKCINEVNNCTVYNFCSSSSIFIDASCFRHYFFYILKESSSKSINKHTVFWIQETKIVNQPNPGNTIDQRRATFCIVEATLRFTFRTQTGVENWQIDYNKMKRKNERKIWTLELFLLWF